MRTITVVTGTDTGVGKTIVTAALAAAATAAGQRVVVVKPGQTGTDDDAAVIADLAGVRTVTLASYPDPLAPLAAARVSGLPALMLTLVTEQILALDADLILIEGAGGLLVPMGSGGWTIADLAATLGARCVVVARAGLGTLNHTALTLEALEHRGLAADVVIGSWPADPELVHRLNREDLPGNVIGAIPEGAGSLPPEEFRARAAEWFTAG